MKIAALAYLVAIIAAIAGWVLNFVAVVHLASADAPFTTMGILRIVGIPVGILGAVLGWF
ncbi:transmembrane 9 family protein [Mesorhizobium sp. B3-1-3]|uniref:transmembrane 9 family protein n=1 Tax=unclassified Mesorhizobium TaxID=325217 RepID=UPI001126321A|nr:MULTISPECIES: transmembrane 9 family protein [unclassified Mesorhizobium]TPI67584.1 transmembrane 9 family protein [Mesorhizobium sp. B3-1-8]TPI75630.1 transmembrane 9 family protein [Mesorhizobium sp. B3-1-3]